MQRPEIDKSGIVRAAAEHATARERFATQTALVTSKREAVAAAKIARDAAVVDAAKGRAGADPASAQKALRDAEAELELAERLESAMQHHSTAAARAHVDSESDAYRPLIAYGARLRIDAAHRYARGLAELEAALQDSANAEGPIREAERHGAKIPLPDGAMLAPLTRHHLGEVPIALQRYLRTPQLEASLWGVSA